MIFHKLNSEDTFAQVFETRSVTLHVSQLLALCFYSETDGYVQPNVNHHFINENSSFEELEKAVRNAIAGDGTVSNEYDAVLTQKAPLTNSNEELHLPCYNVVTEELHKATGVTVVDSWVFSTFVANLDNLKQVIENFKENGEGFVSFMKQMEKEVCGLVLAFLDGLHRSYSLVEMAKESEENFWSILNCNMNVTINFFVLKNDQMEGILPPLSQVKTLLALKQVDMEIVLQLLQDKSGLLMLSKKATVGHTVLDAFAVLSRSIRNNDLNVYLASAIKEVKIKKKTEHRHIMVEYNTGPEGHKDFEEMNTKLFLEKFFKTFFFNSGFEEWAKQGLPLTEKGNIMKEDGSFRVQETFAGFFDKWKWEILFTLKGDIKICRSIITERGPCGYGRNHRLFGKTNLSYANMLLVSMSRLFILTPNIRESALANMGNMHHYGILTKERLLFISGIADHVATSLWEFYSTHTKKMPPTKMAVRFILRTNVENLLLSLYSKENFEQVLTKDFKISFKLPYQLEFEQSILYNLWGFDSSLKEDVLQRTMFLDGLAFSYGRYIFYFLMGSPFFYPEFLPVLKTLIFGKTRNQISKELSTPFATDTEHLPSLYEDFEINTHIPTDLLHEMSERDEHFHFTTISAFDFLRGCKKGFKEKKNVDDFNWDPIYPIPLMSWALSSMRDLSQVFQPNKVKSFDNFIQKFNSYHENDTAFITDTISPQKRKRSPSTPTTSTSKKSKPIVLDDDDTDDDAMNNKRRFEYSFVGLPVQEDISNEPMDTENEHKCSEYCLDPNTGLKKDQKIPAKSTEVSTKNTNEQDIEKENVNEKSEDEESPNSDDESTSEEEEFQSIVSKQAEQKDADSEENEEEHQELENNEENNENQKRRSERIASQTSVDDEANEDEEDTTMPEENRPAKSLLPQEKKYLLFKAYRTFKFIFTDKLFSQNDSEHKTSMVEMFTKMYWFTHLSNHKRTFMFENHEKIIVDIYTKAMKKDFFPIQNYDVENNKICDESMNLMGVLFNTPQKPEPPINKTFNFVENALQQIKDSQKKLKVILDTYSFNPTPFQTNCTFLADYLDNGFSPCEHNLQEITFLDPFDLYREIEIFTARDVERKEVEKLLLDCFGIKKSNLLSHSFRGETKSFWFKVDDTVDLFEDILVRSNEVVACANLVRHRNGWFRMQFRYANSPSFLEDLQYDEIFKIVENDGTIHIAPYDRPKALPCYHDYFQVVPPIEEEGLEVMDLELLPAVAKILGVDESIIKEATNVKQEGQWFVCKDRSDLFEGLFQSEELEHVTKHSDDEIHESDSESCSDEEDDDVKTSQSNRRVTRSQTTTQKPKCRLERMSNKYYFKIQDKKHYIQFAILSSTDEPRYYDFDENIYEIHEMYKNISS